MNAFDWKGQPAQIHIEDTSVRRHKRGTRGMLSSPLSSSWSRSIAQCDLAGTVIRSYPSIQSAARDLGIDALLISRCVNGNAESAGGFIFKAIGGLGSRR